MKILKVIIFVMIIILGGTNILANDEVNESSDIPLEVETYMDGKNQLTHPSVISFEEKWNGYKYWMAYTPYPYASGGEENPSIAVSNDMLKWETPKGLANPIATNEELGCNELKDSHILYRDDLDRIEVWYLGRINKNISLSDYDENQLTLFRKYSYDGINWSKYEIMSSVDYLSPSIIWKDNKYMIWQIGFDTYNTEGTVQYTESYDGINWINSKDCSINGNSNNIKMWHGSVTYNQEKEIYEMVYIEDGGMNSEILYASSNDGIAFEKPIQLLTLSDKWNRFYRPFLLYDDNYYLVYGVVTDNNEWYISMNKGASLETLNFLTQDDKELMIGLQYPELNKNIITQIKEIIHESKNFIRYEIYILPFLFVLMLLSLDKSNDYQYSHFLLVELFVIIAYLFVKFGFDINFCQLVAILFMIITNLLVSLGLYKLIENKDL